MCAKYSDLVYWLWAFDDGRFSMMPGAKHPWTAVDSLREGLQRYRERFPDKAVAAVWVHPDALERLAGFEDEPVVGHTVVDRGHAWVVPAQDAGIMPEAGE